MGALSVCYDGKNSMRAAGLVVSMSMRDLWVVPKTVPTMPSLAIQAISSSYGVNDEVRGKETWSYSVMWEIVDEILDLADFDFDVDVVDG